MQSWLNSVGLCGPTACAAMSGHGLYCPNESSCRSDTESELQVLKDQMQLIVQLAGIKNIFKTNMRFEGASSVARETEPSEEATEAFSVAPWVTPRPRMPALAGQSLTKELSSLVPRAGLRLQG